MDREENKHQDSGYREEIIELFPGVYFEHYQAERSFECARPAQFQPHQALAIHYCLRGAFEGELKNGRIFHRSAGQVSISHYGLEMTASRIPHDSYEAISLVIYYEETPHFLQEMFSWLEVDFYRLIQEKDLRNKEFALQPDPDLVRVFLKLYKLMEAGDLAALRLAALSLIQAIGGVRPIVGKTYIQMNNYRLVQEVCTKLEEAENMELSIKEVLDQALPYSIFQKIFREIYGQSPGQYRRDHLLSQAANLLQNTDLKIAEIALRVGYENPSKFSAAFKRKFGILPSYYRRHNS